MVAVVAQYIKESGLAESTGLSVRTLANSLLMSTSTPLIEEDSNSYYSIILQGSGLANVGNAVTANAYILMGSDATEAAADGKVKAELGDDPDKTGVYSYTFTINNITDTANEYTLSADIFTQDLFTYGDYTYMDTWTTPVAASVTYTVDGTAYVPTSAVVCDLDADGDTDADDAQIILNYVAGLIDEIDEAADVDGDGEITTYDAYLILDSMETRVVEVPANGSVTVAVTITLASSTKEYLNTYYDGGAYIEGYVFVNPVATEEGEIAPTLSIVSLAFYGSWTDASMYDKVSYTEYLYGDETPTYTGYTATNNLIIRYSGSTTGYYAIGNPYFIEDEYPEGREAISSSSTLYQYYVSLIRNAGALTYYVQDSEGNVISINTPTPQVTGAYYYVNGSAWYNRRSTYTMNQKVSALGLSEGDTFTVGIVAIPEYYETDGALTAEEITELIESGALGEGAYLSNTFTIDNTAPEIIDVTKSLVSGKLTVLMQDNQYIAAVEVLNSTGSEVIAASIPAQDEAGEVCSVEVELDDSAGEYITILVADYAGNETVYQVKYGGDPIDYSGRMYAFTDSSYRGSGNRWIEIDKDTLWYWGESECGGTVDVATTDLTVLAAEYVNGYVFMAADDGYFYVTEQGDWSNVEKVGYYDNSAREIRDMAFNYSDNQLYVLALENSYDNVLYTMDIVSGTLTRVAQITISNPISSTANRSRLLTLAIDDDGNFYSINYGSHTYTLLFTWTLDDVVDGEINNLAPVSNTALGYYQYTYSGAMAWDHDNDILYWASSGSSTGGNSRNCLLIVDPETGTATKANDYYPDDYIADCASRLYVNATGLYIVPSSNQQDVTTDTATSIEMRESSLNILKGVTTALTVDVYPWSLSDKTVTWTTSDESIVTVDENGSIEAVGVGTATVSATTNAAPNLTATCEITVSQLDTISLTGLVYDADGATYWSDFNSDDPSDWTKVSDTSGSYYAGTLLDETIYVHDGSTMYGVDADTFEVTNYGTIASSWIWSDAAAAPETSDGSFGRIIGLCYNGTYLEMVNCLDGTLSYWNLSSYYGSDPMAVIAYVGTGTYDYDSYSDCPANFYYMMTESGELYYLTVFTYTSGSNYTLVRTDLGSTGLDLTNVSTVTGGTYASMIYDEATGYLIISSYQEGNSAQLYAVSPNELLPAKLGEFGEDVWPVVSLYQYDRITELTVKISESEISIYKNDTVDLTATVKPKTYTSGVTWTSSDTSVATVDENGVVTGVSEGTAVITATSIDTNDAGETASASCSVTVTGIIDVSAKINAQITTDDGTEWVTIDTSTLTYTVNATTETTFTGGGYSASYIYGSDVDMSDNYNTGSIYRVDPDTYTQTAGGTITGYYGILDVAENPEIAYTYTDDGGTEQTVNGFGYPLFLAQMQGVYMLTDYESSSVLGWDLSSTYSKLAAIAYVGQTTCTYSDVTYDSNMWYMLGTDGKIYRFLAFCEDPENGGYRRVSNPVTQIDLTFSSYKNLSMTYVEFSEDDYGFIVADNSGDNAALYYINMAGDTVTYGKIGNVQGATGITSLYAATPASANAISDLTMDVREGTSTTSSSLVDVCEDVEQINEPQVAKEINLSESATNTVSGSTNALTLTAVSKAPVKNDTQETGAEVTDGTVELTLTEDVAVTNGLIKVTYDPTVLAYTGTTSTIGNTAVSVDAENGVITFAYASAKALAANDTLAVISFTCIGEYTKTTITAETLQRNDNLAVTGESVTLDVEYEDGDHDYVVTDSKDATCTEDGYITYTCTKCGDTYTEVIPATGHTYGEPEFTWSEDYASATATFICTSGDDTQTVDATVTSETTDATCTEDGQIVYTATAEFDGVTYTDTKTVVLEATGHTYGEPVFTWSEDYSSATAAFTCEVCGNVETVTAIVTTESTDATCIVTGKVVFTATVELGGVTYTDTKTVESALANHTYGEAVFTWSEDYSSATVTATCSVCGESVTETADVTSVASYEDAEITYTATVVLGGVTFTDTKTVEIVNPFTDVDEDDYFYAPVLWAIENGITTGTSDTTFSPFVTAERCQVVTFLWRAAGCPEVDEDVENPFTDVTEEDYFYTAVLWAVENGITTGTSDTTFSPYDLCERCQVVTFLYRYFGQPEVTATENPFTDVDTDDYFYNAVLWAVENGITTGTTENTFGPFVTCERCMVVTFLYRAEMM